MVGRWLLAGILLICGWAAHAEGVSLRVEPDPPQANESFQLTFETAGAVDQDPDFSALEADFQVLGRNQQTAIELINGRHTRRTAWTLTVLPKHASPLVIPAISFGNLKSAPRQVALANGAGGTSATDDGLFLEVEVSPHNPYVQQEVLYTIRLWRRYEISNASLSEPRFSSDVLVKPLDEDRHYESTRDGKRFEVVERRFVLYPQTSGKLNIQPAEVTAQVVKRGFSLFDTFAQAMATKRVVSDALVLEVKPVPASFPGQHWLPARKLRLQDEWQPATREAQVGEPISRTITLWAEGITAGQLPPVTVTAPRDWKIYPERPQTNDQQQDASFSGALAQKMALIANQSGELELPPVEVPWWNTTTDQLEYARTPSIRLTALPAADTAPPPAESSVTAAIVSSNPAPAPDVPSPALTVPVDFPAQSLWRWIAMLALAGWLGSVLLWWRHAARIPNPDPIYPASPTPIGARAIEAACRSGEPREIREALLAWAASQWPHSPPRTLGQIAAQVDEPLRSALLALDAQLYGNTQARIDGAALALAWRTHQNTTRKSVASKSTSLPKLYPSTAD